MNLIDLVRYDFSCFSSNSIDIWHIRLGHANHSVIETMETEQSVVGLNVSSDPVNELPCEGCCLGKSHQQPFPTICRRRATKIGEIIHSDLYGPFNVPSLANSLYYVLFQGDMSGFRVVCFLKKKSEDFDYFKIYVARVYPRLVAKLILSELIMVANILTGDFNSFFFQIPFVTRLVFLTHQSRMVLVNGPTVH